MPTDALAPKVTRASKGMFIGCEEQRISIFVSFLIIPSASTMLKGGYTGFTLLLAKISKKFASMFVCWFVCLLVCQFCQA